MLLIFGIAAAGALAVAGYAWLAQRNPAGAARAARAVRQLVAVVAVLARAVDGVLDALQGRPEPQAASHPRPLWARLQEGDGSREPDDQHAQRDEELDHDTWLEDENES